MDTDLVERDSGMISAGGAYQKEDFVVEESVGHLYKVLDGRFTMSHLRIRGLATARGQPGVSVYGVHMLAEDVWVQCFRGGETEAIISNLEEAQVQEERCHQCWGWSTDLHEKAGFSAEAGWGKVEANNISKGVHSMSASYQDRENQGTSMGRGMDENGSKSR